MRCLLAGRWLTKQVGSIGVSVVAAAFLGRLLTSGSVQPRHHERPPVTLGSAVAPI